MDINRIRNRINRRKNYAVNNLKEASIQFNNDHFFDDFNSYEAYINLDKNNKIDIRVLSTGDEDKEIMFRPRTVIPTGTYITWGEENNEKTYIITEFNDDKLTPKAKGLWCNETLTIQGLDDKIYTYPCSVKNDSYGSKQDRSSDFLSFNDTKAKITVVSNPITSLIGRNYRFIFNHSKFDIYKTIDKSSAIVHGVFEMVSSKDLFMEEDNLELNIAYNSTDLSEDIQNIEDPTKVTYEIIGKDYIVLNKTEEYEIYPPISCTFEIADTTIAEIISSTSTSCVIKCLEGNDIAVLYAKDVSGNILCEYIITTLNK